MSSNNGIYILETKDKEYRVAYCLDIDEYYQEESYYSYNVLYLYFKDSLVYNSLKDAQKRALELQKEIPFTENGICYIYCKNYKFKNIDLQKPVCSYCGSDEVNIDSYSTWNTYTQSWELDTTYDEYHCSNCGKECSVKWEKL